MKYGITSNNKALCSVKTLNFPPVKTIKLRQRSLFTVTSMYYLIRNFSARTFRKGVCN